MSKVMTEEQIEQMRHLATHFDQTADILDENVEQAETIRLKEFCDDNAFNDIENATVLIQGAAKSLQRIAGNHQAIRESDEDKDGEDVEYRASTDYRMPPRE